MREELNALIAASEAKRCLAMPRIGPGHSEFTGGIFSLLQDPGGNVHTLGSGAMVSRFVDIENDDPTANWCNALFQRLRISKAAITPWNALAAYGEKPSVKSIKDNWLLCQQLVNTALPVAIVAQGKWAQLMADRLVIGCPVFRVPHPSRRGRASYRGAAEDIEAAFKSAWLQCRMNILERVSA